MVAVLLGMAESKILIFGWRKECISQCEEYNNSDIMALSTRPNIPTVCTLKKVVKKRIPAPTTVPDLLSWPVPQPSAKFDENQYNAFCIILIKQSRVKT